jgi:hypothetical protein
MHYLTDRERYFKTMGIFFIMKVAITSTGKDLASLRQDADALREQLSSILVRIDEMGKK